MNEGFIYPYWLRVFFGMLYIKLTIPLYTTTQKGVAPEPLYTHFCGRGRSAFPRPRCARALSCDFQNFWCFYFTNNILKIKLKTQFQNTLQFSDLKSRQPKHSTIYYYIIYNALVYFIEVTTTFIYSNDILYSATNNQETSYGIPSTWRVAYPIAHKTLGVSSKSNALTSTHTTS